MTREIRLTKGYIAIVDDEDFDAVSKFSWHANDNGRRVYAARKSCGSNFWMHREIIDAPSEMKVDHIDNNGLNNRRSNLRLATVTQNNANTGLRRNNKSGHKGVFWNRQMKKWQAQIRFENKCFHLGYFTDVGLAAEAYADAAQRLFGEFSRLK